jgi:hypothetical protein
LRPSGSAFASFRFPSGVIVLAVRWYSRYGLSYRDVEELLVERRVQVNHVTVYRWVAAGSRRCWPMRPGLPVTRRVGPYESPPRSPSWHRRSEAQAQQRFTMPAAGTTQQRPMQV